ncbi:hypothetical protein [Streptomyces sp. NPDC059575]|uniref:hypothetical protein n=1 Tax=Streptomyces sp. NPDC059575 TaxID=3346872 RepID=UPI00368A51CC
MILVYVFTLPALIVVGWLLSWWGSWRVRRIVLSGAAVVSLLCAVIGWQSMGPPSTPQSIGCRPALACLDMRPVFVVADGVSGLGCCFVLLLLTIGVEALLTWRRRRVVAG